MRERKEVQAVIFDEANGKRKFLLIKMLDLKDNRYHWRLVKGGVEKGETEEEALKREIKEEVGLENIQIISKIYNYNFIFQDVDHIISTFSVKGSMEEKPILGIDGDRPIIKCKWASKFQAMKMLYWKDEKTAIRKSC